MKFTIILPLYNNEKTLKRCMESILDQTYSDWEIIAINDGSTDGTRKILTKYAMQDTRIHILDKEHKGPGAARNAGMCAATGDYIAFIDGDDKWESNNCLEEINKIITRKHPAVLGTFVSIIDMHGNKGEHSIHRQYISQDEKTGKWIEFAEEQDCFCFWSYIYSKNFLQKERICFPDFLRFQDPVFLVQVLHAAKKYYLLPIEFYCNIWHESDELNAKQRHDLYRAQIWLMRFASVFQYEKLVVKLKSRNVSLKHECVEDLYLHEEWLKAGYKGEQPEITTSFLFNYWIQNSKETFLRECNDASKIVIYGAGEKGKLVLNYILSCVQSMTTKIIFAVTGVPGIAQIEGIQVKNIYDVKVNDSLNLILVARQAEYRAEMINTIETLGCKNYYYWSDVWKMLLKKRGM